MNNWKVIPTIILATVLIFGAGVVTGGILVDYVKQNHQRMGARRPNPQLPTNTVATTVASTNAAPRLPRAPEILSKDFVQRLDTELHLTKEQRESIQKIVGDGQNLMRKVVQDARLEIREALTDPQRQQFDDLLKRPFHKPLFNTNAPPTNTPVISTNLP